MAYHCYLVKKPCYLQVMVSHLVTIAAAVVEPVAKQHFADVANEAFAAVAADPVAVDGQTIEETGQLSEPQKLCAVLVAVPAVALVTELVVEPAAAADVAPAVALAVN